MTTSHFDDDGKRIGVRQCSSTPRMASFMRRFYDEVGAEKMAACYGWEAPLDRFRPGEAMLFLEVLVPAALHAVQSPDPLVTYDYWVYDATGGWALILRDPREPAIQELTIGVRPKYHGRGWRRQLLRLASDWAFEHYGAETVSVFIRNDNAVQIDKYEADEKAGGPFQKAGRIWFPEPEAGLRFTRVKPGMEGSVEGAEYDRFETEAPGIRTTAQKIADGDLVFPGAPRPLSPAPDWAPRPSKMEWIVDTDDPAIDVWMDGKILHIRKIS